MTKLEVAATKFAEKNYSWLKNALPTLAAMKSFKAGAEWMRSETINKACEWLEKNACNYEYSGGTCDSWFSASDLVESFRKYMEEQQ